MTTKTMKGPVETVAAQAAVPYAIGLTSKADLAQHRVHLSFLSGLGNRYG